MSTLFEQVAELPVTVDKHSLELLERETSSGFSRTTTVFSLYGSDACGRGEDVTYETDDHLALHEARESFDLEGNYTIASFSAFVADLELFPGNGPSRPDFRAYRRWALESAALDLSLKQADSSLAEVLDRQYEPVRFVVSTRLGDPPSLDALENWLDVDSTLEFKLDATADWTESIIEGVAGTDAVVSLDLKGYYEGTEVDSPADAEFYERILHAFPEAVIEDPAVTPETRPLFDGHEDRIAWDYPITDVDAIEALPWQPHWLNIKPSRFGSIATLFEVIEYCRSHDINMYGGGQFELGPGREHLHALASMWYPDGPNDVAPGEYNSPDPRPGLPSSPLHPPHDPVGLEWPSR